MKEKPNYYAIIPADVRYNEKLNSSEKIFYSEITSLTKTNGECWASNNYFARLYKVSPSSISNWVKKLEEEDFITVEYKKKGKEIIQRIIKLKGIQNIEEGYSKFLEENKEEEAKEIYKERNIFELIEKNIGRTLSPIEIEIINSWDYEYEIIELAVKEAVLHNAKTIKYIDRIIFNWKQNKIESKEEAYKYLNEFSNKGKSIKKEEKKVVNYYKDLDE